ncbi:trem-like transcript 1 protein isoform X2 [Urocitellus parryii]|uniref:trem-like transcript 1 protein isoform X2 n=1 Tax=Urocitellus parryii TaxID=9999 RepID=UPI000E560A04|nr:trem-like transcript 1 protein isoform X2 [Urocitellus parryii]
MGPRLLLLLLLGRAEEEEETHKHGSLAEDPSLDPAGSASPWEPSQQKSIPLIWCAVSLLGLLVAAVVLFAVMTKKRGNRPDVCDQFPSQRVAGTGPSLVVHHIHDSGPAAGLPLDAPCARIDSSLSFDNAAYASLPLDCPPGKPPSPSSPPLPPKVLSPPNL